MGSVPRSHSADSPPTPLLHTVLPLESTPGSRCGRALQAHAENGLSRIRNDHG